MNTYKIMIVDDESDILALLEESLNIEGFHNIYKINNGQSAVQHFSEINPDLVILDIMLPDLDGFEVCKKIRMLSNCPILFLSSKNEEFDKILGLAVGGDDYITKPFSPKEVAYRVKAQLRRLEYTRSDPQFNKIKIGELILDLNSCTITKNNESISLTAREFEILKFFFQNINCVISRERLYEAIWGECSLGCDNTIMVHIRHLREKIENTPTTPQYIITVKGLGYKLVNPYAK